MKKTYDRKFFRQKLLSERKTVTAVTQLLIVLLLGFPLLLQAETGVSSRIRDISDILPNVSVRQDSTESRKTGTQKQTFYEGEVMDTEGNPLPGVTVLLKGTTTGTSTNTNGEFRFPATQTSKSVLVFSFIGMKSVEKDVTPGKRIVVRMEEDVTGIEEVVITGIYSRDKNSYTGSATTYSAQELKMVGAQNVIQSLKTLDPAMLVVESKQWGSDPNRMPKIEIRGKTSVVGLQAEFENDPNQPLFILDGVETTLETIINLNIDRVASVTLLKDAASTAIYGSKAANGVIVVETKSPEAGQLRLSYNGNYGISFADLSDYNLMNASEKLEFELLAGRYSPLEGYEGFVDKLQKMSDYYARLKGVLRGVDTYWLSEPLRTVFNHSHNVYIDGGDQAMRYGLGISYNNRDGVMKKSNRDGIGVNIDLIYRKKGLLFSNKASLDISNSEREPVAFSEFSRANPYYQKRLDNGTIPMYLERVTGIHGEDMFNPLYVWNIENTNTSKDLALRDNFTMEWTVFDALRTRARLGFSKSITKSEAFKSPNHVDFLETEKLKKGS